MTYINDLIRQYCPTGVEYKELGKVLKPKENIHWKSNTDNTFQYIDLGSVDRATHKISDTIEVNSKTAPSRAQQIVREGDVLFGTTRPTLKRYTIIDADFDGQIASTGFCVLRPTDELLTNYLFHVVGSSDFNNYVELMQKGASYPSISDAKVKKYKIPVPPLELQQEIANILDKFKSLGAELEAELEIRRMQYDCYQSQMLREIVESKDTKWNTLGKAAQIKVGQKPTNIETAGRYPYINAGNDASGFTDKANTDGGAITIPSRGQGSAGHVGYQHDDFWCGPLCYKIRSEVEELDTRFLYYYLKSEQSSIVAMRKTGSIPAVNKKELELIPVPIPNPKEQHRLIQFLNKLDALTNNTVEGIPAEIAARRKQYEYYSEMLLEFQELPA